MNPVRAKAERSLKNVALFENQRMVDFEKENKVIDNICDSLSMPKNDYVSIDVAASYLGLSPRQTRHLCQNGSLGSKHGQKSWVITRLELIAFKPNKPPTGRPRGRKPI